MEAGPGAERFAADPAAPEPLRAWLSAAVDATIALHGTSLDRGPALKLQVCLAMIAHTANTFHFYEPHWAAFQRDSALQRSLVQLLLPVLHTAAVAMPLPADRWPPELDFHMASLVFDLLAVPELTGALRVELALSGSGVSSGARRALQSTLQLFAAAPSRSCPVEAPPDVMAHYWICLTRLLGTLCSLLNEALLRQGSAAQRQPLVQQVLRVLPQLPAGLRLILEWDQLPTDGLDVSVFAGAVVEQCANIVAFIDPCWPERIDSAAAGRSRAWEFVVNNLAELSVCCAASSALLRALPHMAALAALPDQGQQVEGERAGLEAEAQLIDQLAELVLSFVGNCAAAMDRFSCSLGSGGGPWSAAEGAAATEALWQLHTALCRCFHSTPAGTWAKPDVRGALTSCMYHSMVSAAHISTAVQAGSAETSRGAEASSRCIDAPRHVLAMSLAQAEAILVATGSYQPVPEDIAMAAALLSAIEYGPAALVRSPPVQQALEHMNERLRAAAEGSDGVAVIRDGITTLLHRQPQPGDELELAHVAATRSCAYLRCANLASEGGPAAGKGAGSKRCSKCRVVRYCGTACSHADWRAGHRGACQALGAARAAGLPPPA